MISTKSRWNPTLRGVGSVGAMVRETHKLRRIARRLLSEFIVKVVASIKFFWTSRRVRALLPSCSLLFGDRTNDQLAFTCFDKRRIGLLLGSIKQFLNF